MPATIEVLEIRSVRDCGNLRAFAKARLGCVVIHGCRSHPRRRGKRAWVALPQVPARKKADGERRRLVPCRSDHPIARCSISCAPLVLAAWEARQQPPGAPRPPCMRSSVAADPRQAHVDELAHALRCARARRVGSALVIGTDTITFAWPSDGRTTLAKVIHIRGGRIVGKDPSPNVPTFDYTEAAVRDLRSLYIQVKRAAAHDAIAVRAKPKNPTGNRRIHETDGIEPNLEIVPRRWVAFDWDGLPLELQPCPNPGWSWQPDPLLEPWIGARSRCAACRRLSGTSRASGR